MQYILAIACLANISRIAAQTDFNSCAAAFLDQKMVVDEYSTSGKCTVSIDAKGMLSVSTVDLSPTESKAVDKIRFMLAIRDKNTRTIVMFSTESYKQVPIQKVLARCKAGDSIVVLTQDAQYALPHHEILVQ